MTFEQPASLNRYLIPPIPSGWKFRWQLFKVFLPLQLFTGVTIFQTLLLTQWVSGHWNIWVFLVVPGILLFVLFAQEVQLRLLLRSKRIIRVEEKYVQPSSGLANRIPWQRVISWQFYNVSGENNYRIAAIEYQWEKDRRQRLRNRFIVLDKFQVNQLISELKFRQQKDGLTFSISDHETDWPLKPLEFKSGNRASLWLYLTGVLLILDGWGPLLVGLGIHSNSSDHHVTPGPVFLKFIRSHFATVTEYRHFLLLADGILCTSGAVLMIWSILLSKREKARQQTPAAKT
jgi:hypothetical protein